jgi:hypothetical protein
MRKCDFLKDHIRRVELIRQGEKIRYPFEKEAREVLIDELIEPFSDFKKKSARMAPAVMIGARYIGRIFGKKLHRAVLDGSVPLEKVQSFFWSAGTTKISLSPLFSS